MTEEVTTQPTGEEATKTYTQEQVESKVNNFITQITDLKTQLSTLSQESEAAKAEREKVEAEKLAKKEEWKTLSEQQADKMLQLEEAHKARVTDLEAEILNMKQDAAIAQAGITDELAILGLKMKYAQLGEEAPPMSDWLESLKADKPDLFAPPSGKAGTSNAAAGTVKPAGSLTDEYAEELFKSNDPAKRAQATEHFKQQYNLDRRF